jgi:hypothetical protein
MKLKILILLCAISLSTISSCAEKRATFHPPQTEAERALDGIMHRHYDADTVYSQSFKEFINVFKEKQRNGECKEPVTDLRNIVCEDTDSLPVGASVEFKYYMYRTVHEDGKEATVEISPKDFLIEYPNSRPDTYFFRKEGGKWKLDGIDYGGFFKMNRPIENYLKEYHLAASPAEKVLDKVLKLNEGREHDVYAFVFALPYIKYKEDKVLEPLFTQSLLERSTKEERELIKESCGGAMPKDNRPCDMYRDVNPISCAQDVPGVYIYKTIRANNKEAIIQYIWPNSEPFTGPSYRLVYNDGLWRLDGVCLEKKDAR